MVKKKFIDKRNAVTYSLVYRSTEDADDVPDRVLVDAEKKVGIGRVDVDAAAATHEAVEQAGRRFPPGHPLSWLYDEPQAAPVTEERRRELIELGFPDDGYDYLKHMRMLGPGRGSATLEGMPAAAAAASAAAAAEAEATAAAAAAAAAAPGPSVFMAAPAVQAPEEDRRLIDASRLTVMQRVEQEADAAVMAGGVTAFSREKSRVHGLGKRELEELQAAMQELEEDEEYGDAEGAGDLLDDFVLAATEMGAEEAGQEQQEEGQPGDSASEYSEVESYEDEEEGSSYAGSAGDASQAGTQAGRSASGRPPARPGSIASTYWRDERTDRKNMLTVIDERFEHLALEYDEEEIGDLEEQGEDIRGFADVKEFDNLLDEFLEAHGQSQQGHEGNVPYAAPRVSVVAKEMEFFGFDDADAGIAILKAQEALQRAEAELNAEEEKEGSSGSKQGPAAIPFLEARERERWDCESVLSLRSNLDNHPGRISEPRGPRRPRSTASTAAGGAGAAAQGIIRLDPRSGIPMGVLPPRRGAGAAPESAAAAAGGTAQQQEGEDEQGQEGGLALPLERRKGESAEEKKARKAAVKEAQRNARSHKKELKTLFKDASVAAQRRAATAQPQAALKLPS